MIRWIAAIVMVNLAATAGLAVWIGTGDRSRPEESGLEEVLQKQRTEREELERQVASLEREISLLQGSLAAAQSRMQNAEQDLAVLREEVRNSKPSAPLAGDVPPSSGTAEGEADPEKQKAREMMDRFATQMMDRAQRERDRFLDRFRKGGEELEKERQEELDRNLRRIDEAVKLNDAEKEATRRVLGNVDGHFRTRLQGLLAGGRTPTKEEMRGLLEEAGRMQDRQMQGVLAGERYDEYQQQEEQRRRQVGMFIDFMFE